jgi:hypothetical protein
MIAAIAAITSLFLVAGIIYRQTHGGCRSAYRKERPPSEYHLSSVGFRVVCEINPANP